MDGEYTRKHKHNITAAKDALAMQYQIGIGKKGGAQLSSL